MRYVTLGEVVELHRRLLQAAPVDVQERLVLDLAAGQLDRGQLADWLRQHFKPFG